MSRTTMTNIGLNENFDTAVVVGGNTYSIKDTLKSLGYHYDDLYGWHADPSTVDAALLPAPFTLLLLNERDLCHEWLQRVADGTTEIDHLTDFIRQTIRDYNASLNNYDSQWEEGAIGDRLRDLEVVCTEIVPCESYAIYTFYHGANRLSWITSTHPSIQQGSHYSLTGTIKRFGTLSTGEKQTSLNRCVVKEV